VTPKNGATSKNGATPKNGAGLIGQNAPVTIAPWEPTNASTKSANAPTSGARRHYAPRNDVVFAMQRRLKAAWRSGKETRSRR